MSLRLLSIYMALILILVANSCSSNSSDDKDTEIKENITVLVLSNFEEGNNWIDTTYVKHMTGITFLSIDIGDIIPRMDDFVDIDVVLLYEDGTFDNAESVGDSIYAFVMGGGNLVLGTFYWQDRGDGGYDGNWGSLEMIDPLFGGSCDYEYDSLGVLNDHYMTSGINSLVTYYRGVGDDNADSLRNNATAIAWWMDGDPLIAFNKPGGTITAVSTAPQEGYYWDSRQDPNEPEGDFFKLWENVLKWTGSQGSGFSKEAAAFFKTPSISKKQQSTNRETRGGGRNR